MEKSLLYVSRSLLNPDNFSMEVDRIVATSRARNLRLRVTGGLIATIDGFAQILEGETASIDEIFGYIFRDVRHTDVTVHSYHHITRRRFEQWSLAYSGPASYVAGHLEPLLNVSSPTPTGADVQRLEKLMFEFGRAV